MGGTVFFDYDGTLHDSMHLYGPAFRRAYAALVTDGWAAPRTFSDEEIASWLGYSPAAMWASFMPELPEAIWQRASAAIGEEMRRLLAAGAGRLYPGAKAMLESLREEGCTLVFLSNCSGSYRDEHIAAFGLGGCSPAPGAPKTSKGWRSGRSTGRFAHVTRSPTSWSATGTTIRRWPCTETFPLSGAPTDSERQTSSAGRTSW